MKILRATFLGIRGVADAAYDLTNPSTGAPNPVVLVTGPEASGKTRFLEAILATKEAIGPYGPMSAGAMWLRPGSQIAKVVLTFALEEEERQYVGTSESVVEGEATFLRDRMRRDADEGLVALLARYEHGTSAGKVEYFPASRRLSPLGPFHGTSAIEQRLQRASKEPTKYGFIVRLLRELPQKPNEQRDFARLLEGLSPSCRYISTESEPGLPRCFSSRNGPAVNVSELSETEQQSVLLAATSVAIGLSRSLILMDRPELATSPARAGAFIEAVKTLGQDNQVIMASSAPEFVAAMHKSCVISMEGA